jgi:hypothetical protein
MAFYGFSDTRKLLDTPVVTFWMLHKNIDRLNAEDGFRTADIAIRSQSSEGVTALFADLKTQMKSPIVFEFDRAAMEQEREEEDVDREGLHSLGTIGKVYG